MTPVIVSFFAFINFDLGDVKYSETLYCLKKKPRDTLSPYFFHTEADTGVELLLNDFEGTGFGFEGSLSLSFSFERQRTVRRVSCY